MTEYTFDMARSFLSIFFRKILRDKMFFLCNILGLAIGLACCLAIYLYTSYELSYDQGHIHAADIFLLGSKSSAGVSANKEFPYTSAPYAKSVNDAFPEVLGATRLYKNMLEDKTLLQADQISGGVKSIYEGNGYQVDTNFFEFFSYHFKEGSALFSLAERKSIVLSETLANKLFDNQLALGRIVRVGGSAGNGEFYKVTGVFENGINPSHINASFFLPLSSGWIGTFLQNEGHNFLRNNMFFTYVRLRPKSRIIAVQKKLSGFIANYIGEELKSVGATMELFFVPVTELHLHSEFSSVVTATTSKVYLNLLNSIAVFILLIACINFMNLTTARSIDRAREIGMRKVLGARRSGLVWHFMLESIAMSIGSLIVAFCLLVLTLPLFSQLTGRQFDLYSMFHPSALLFSAMLCIATGIIAGVYPAFYLSKFNPIGVLKGNLQNKFSAGSLRRILIVFQFGISVGLVTIALAISEQMEYLRSKSLGFNSTNNLVIPLRGSESKLKYQALRQELSNHKHVISVSGTNYYPGIHNSTDFNLQLPSASPLDAFNVKTNGVDFDFLSTLGFHLVGGRGFSREFPSDTGNNLVVNQTLLKQFGIPLSEAVGRKLQFNQDNQTTFFEIIGVVGDFHFEDLHHPIVPYAFQLQSGAEFNYIIVHFDGGSAEQLVLELSAKWKSIVQSEPFDYSFLDLDFHGNYRSDLRTAAIVNAFTTLSIFISCLGLFGLATFAAQQRAREIGIRKVLGESVTGIVVLLCKDLFSLVAIATCIASPLAWYGMNRWLETFPYRIQMPWWTFFVSTVIILFVGFLTVLHQSIRAASINPVISLRS